MAKGNKKARPHNQPKPIAESKRRIITTSTGKRVTVRPSALVGPGRNKNKFMDIIREPIIRQKGKPGTPSSGVYGRVKKGLSKSQPESKGKTRNTARSPGITHKIGTGIRKIGKYLRKKGGEMRAGGTH